MDNLYIIILAALLGLAIIDLIVGVSNDAVNFLNSAIGSKAISFRNILIIASLGIFVGAIFSSGMMEVARKGIFMPGEFYFSEIMIIFISVMIADVLLLDFYNSLGLPTSTTVSIVFELLGAAVVMALIKIGMDDAQSVADLGTYINKDKAVMIITGILLSVFIAFTIGAAVQWLTRLVFTFQYEKKVQSVGFLFAAVCLTAISYFIFFKGLKGTPYYGDIKDVLAAYNIAIIAGLFVLWSGAAYVINNVFKKNVLVLVIGIGTFALALAFAGNDLVNFIGVPMAAYHSYEAWSASGVAASEFSMGVLSEKVPSEPILLFLAGGIMVLTLWFSKKAQTVVETGIDLSRQDEGNDRFSANFLSRGIVKGSSRAVSLLSAFVPQRTLDHVADSFSRPIQNISADKAKELPAFDNIRASINLAVAGVLISIATSMKLPLSTTYVTFMVAMGTSFADRAWGRESAVYRVAGVLTVIGGWFLTAISAFAVAGGLTYVIFLGQEAAIAVLLIVAVGLLLRSYRSHKRKVANIGVVAGLRKFESKTVQGIIDESADNISNAMGRVAKSYGAMIDGLANMDESELNNNRKRVDKLDGEVEGLRNHLFYFIKNLDETSVRGSNFYITILAYLTDMVQSLEYLAKKSYSHVNNNHKALHPDQLHELRTIGSDVNVVVLQVKALFESRDFDGLGAVLEAQEAVLARISDVIDAQISRTRAEESSPRNTTLFFNLALETKDLVKALMSLVEEYRNSATNT
ncbi:MAG: inorganic phosphate transporter [Flavobacteriales bacterium]|jgi:phosphate/sulfate permease|nr:inorganic phosphate transporter [Flavobacteriales bacterium]MDG1005616.1 inorganic phosphate transporter [Schleiferiaceae bacterium]MBT3677883.1 inorganic phosphate transporter [Flavobacteriales bacterium]MBT3740351.1 inorganic phosphate transporter [Flavobacteriales bacterium]MBT4102871.1 inorganic phosphate transporter [Flavobacteriales bacterium]